jgi:predicted nucleic acid-binding protein
MTKKLIDSNILIYAYDLSDEKKHKSAKDVLRDLLVNDQAIVSVQNLAEFARAMTEKAKKPISRAEVRQLILEFTDSLKVVTYDGHTIADALLIASKYDLHFYDSLLLATMELHHIDQIVTEDDHFKRISWLKVTNPFKD